MGRKKRKLLLPLRTTKPVKGKTFYESQEAVTREVPQQKTGKVEGNNIAASQGERLEQGRLALTVGGSI